MNAKGFFLVLALSLFGTFAKAQETISDEDLKKYVVAMDSIESMKEGLVETISEMVKGNEEVSAARYNDLYKIIDDSTKLAEAKATEVEIAFVKKVLATKDEETAKINEAFQSLAKDYIGAKTYNSIKKALRTDAELKQRYETMEAELKKKDGGEGETKEGE